MFCYSQRENAVSDYCTDGIGAVEMFIILNLSRTQATWMTYGLHQQQIKKADEKRKKLK